VRGVEARDLSVVRFADVLVEARPDADADAVIDSVQNEIEREVARADGRTVVARVTLRGATRAHQAFQLEPERWDSEIRARGAEFSEVWLSQVHFATRPPVDTAAVFERQDAVGQVLRAVHAARLDPERAKEFSALFSDLAAKLPAEVRAGSEGLRLDDGALLAEILEEVEQLLLVQLSGEDE